LWEWVRYEINSSSVTEFSPNSLDSMPLLAFPGTAILVSRIVGLYFLKANWANEERSTSIAIIATETIRDLAI